MKIYVVGLRALRKDVDWANAERTSSFCGVLPDSGLAFGGVLHPWDSQSHLPPSAAHITCIPRRKCSSDATRELMLSELRQCPNRQPGDCRRSFLASLTS